MTNNIILRKALLSDLELIRNWERQPHVISAKNSDPDNDQEWNWEIELQRSPEWRELLIAELNKRPIGFMQIIDPQQEESHYWGEISEGYKAIDIWIGNESDLGKGYGTEMMRQAIVRCFENKKVNAILIDPLASNKKAHRFYERLGFKFVEQRYFGEDDCLVYELKRKV
ncbi:MAG: acetyltransferase [Cytophagaceae bacterium]|nr:acetyltransferase [Cytophagaceae bacterium]